MKCKYCGKSPAYKPAIAKKTFVCIDCLYDNKQYTKDYERAMQKSIAFKYPIEWKVGRKVVKYSI